MYENVNVSHVGQMWHVVHNLSEPDTRQADVLSNGIVRQVVMFIVSSGKYWDTILGFTPTFYTYFLKLKKYYIFIIMYLSKKILPLRKLNSRWSFKISNALNFVKLCIYVREYVLFSKWPYYSEWRDIKAHVGLCIDSF